MSKTSSHLLLLFFSLSVFSCSIVRCRILEQVSGPSSSSSVFDVSASIQRTIQILSFNPEITQEEHNISSSTLRLYSRDIFNTSPFKSYRDLTISRLNRDSIRMNFLHSQLSTSSFSSMALETPVTSGRSQGSGGEYVVRLGFGTPARPIYTVIDTGSDITWIQCAPCVKCYQQLGPIYDPSNSSSYKLLTCDSQQCNALNFPRCTNANTCVYQVKYGDGSFTVGDFVTETLQLGNSVITNVAIGCGRDNEGLFRGVGGLFGLGGGALSFPSQIESLSFSYCLVYRDSGASSTLEFGSGIPNGALTVPLLANTEHPTFYYVGLTGISVAAKMLSIPSSTFAIDSNGDGGVIVDSGTSVTRFTPEVYTELRDEFVKGTQGLPSAASFSIFDTCYNLTSMSNVEVPTVAFHFGASSWTLPAENYIYPVGEGIFCFGFAQTSGSPSIIGNFQQQGLRVSFDVGRSLIGFSNC